MNCIHELVCKHRVEGDGNKCALGDVCKFISDPSQHIVQPASAKKRSYKKRKYKKRDKKALPLETKKKGSGRSSGNFVHLTTSDKDIARAKNILAIRRSRGKLSENQMAALDMYKGVKKLSELQRQHILNILNEKKRQHRFIMML